MADLPAPLRRHALSVVLTAAAVWVFVGTTLPALEERTLARRRVLEAEQQREQRAEQVRHHELLLETSLSDPMIRERLRANLVRSPDLAGPRVVLPEPDAEGQAAGQFAGQAADQAADQAAPPGGTIPAAWDGAAEETGALER